MARAMDEAIKEGVQLALQESKLFRGSLITLLSQPGSYHGSRCFLAGPRRQRLVPSPDSVHPDEQHAMPGNFVLKVILKLAEILLPPKIPDPMRSMDPQILPLNRDPFRKLGAVEQADGLGAIFHRLRPDFLVASPGDSPGLISQRILINLQHFIICQETVGKRIQFRDVTSYQQGRAEQTPEAHMRVLLIRCESGRMEVAAPAHLSDD